MDLTTQFARVSRSGRENSSARDRSMASSAPPIAAPQDPTSEEDAEYGSSQSSIDDTISVDLVPRLAPSSTPSACFSI